MIDKEKVSFTDLKEKLIAVRNTAASFAEFEEAEEVLSTLKIAHARMMRAQEKKEVWAHSTYKNAVRNLFNSYSYAVLFLEEKYV